MQFSLGSMSNRPGGLAVVETHPVQYHAPVYRALQEQHGIPVTAIYGSDFSVAGYRDPEFQADFAWDTDLLTGYRSIFLSTVKTGGGRTYDTVSGRGIARALRTLMPEAILLVGYSPRFYQWAWLQAMATGCPLLFRGETSDHLQSSGTVKHEIRTRLLRRLYRSCTQLLYIGAHSRRHFEAHGCPERKLVFSPYCVDMTPFQVDEAARRTLRAPARSSLGIREDETVLLFSGKLSHRKGPDLLVAAVNALPPERRSKTVVLFLGSGELQPMLSAAAASVPQIKVFFAGFQNQTRLSPYYHASDLLVLPSRHSETWGLVVNEALHHGVPCIVSDRVGCWPDLVAPHQTGEVVQAGSVEDLTAAILRALPLVENPNVRQQCRTQVGGYTVEKAAVGIAHAYRSVTCEEYEFDRVG